MQCSAGNCKYLTTADAVVPGVVKEGKRANVELGQIQVYDAGSDGDLADHPLINPGHCPPACTTSGDDTLFEVQGLYLP